MINIYLDFLSSIFKTTASPNNNNNKNPPPFRRERTNLRYLCDASYFPSLSNNSTHNLVKFEFVPMTFEAFNSIQFRSDLFQ